MPRKSTEEKEIETTLHDGDDKQRQRKRYRAYQNTQRRKKKKKKETGNSILGRRDVVDIGQLVERHEGRLGRRGALRAPLLIAAAAGVRRHGHQLDAHRAPILLLVHQLAIFARQEDLHTGSTFRTIVKRLGKPPSPENGRNGREKKRKRKTIFDFQKVSFLFHWAGQTSWRIHLSMSAGWIVCRSQWTSSAVDHSHQNAGPSQLT